MVDPTVAVAAVTLIGSLVASMVALFRSMGEHSTKSQSVSSETLAAMSQTIVSLNEQLGESVEKASTERSRHQEEVSLLNSYIVYLIDGIRDRCDWNPKDMRVWKTENI